MKINSAPNNNNLYTAPIFYLDELDFLVTPPEGSLVLVEHILDAFKELLVDLQWYNGTVSSAQPLSGTPV